MWLVLAASALILLSLIISAPLALAHGYASFAGRVYQAFSYLCHQIPERSFHLGGHALAVCARCTGLYAGFTLGALLYPRARSLRTASAPARIWLLIATAALALDYTLDFFGARENTHFSRSVTGALVGGVSAFYVVPGLVAFSRMDWRRAFARDEVSKQRSPQTVETATRAQEAADAPSDYGAPSRRIEI